MSMSTPALSASTAASTRSAATPCWISSRDRVVVADDARRRSPARRAASRAASALCAVIGIAGEIGEGRHDAPRRRRRPPPRRPADAPRAACARRCRPGRNRARRSTAPYAQKCFAAAATRLGATRGRRPESRAPWRAPCAREPRIFARAFDGAAPARIAGDVEHRRESHREAVGRRLARGLARRALPEGLAVEGRGLRERHREDACGGRGSRRGRSAAECRAATPRRRCAACREAGAAPTRLSRLPIVPLRIESVESPAITGPVTV